MSASHLLGLQGLQKTPATLMQLPLMLIFATLHIMQFLSSPKICVIREQRNRKKYLLTLMDLHGSSKELDGTEPSLEPI